MSSEKVKEAFALQAEACRALGSDFTADLCLQFHEHLSEQTSVGKFCLRWDGDPAPSADSIPLRLCGGFHAIVLTDRDAELSGFYPPSGTGVPAWEILERVLLEQEDFLLDWMTSPPQTNEVSRSGVLWPAMMAIASRVSKPLSLLEVGASGGLNLNMDRFSYVLGGEPCGAVNSILSLTPEWRGAAPTVADVSILTRRGCDINPLNPANAKDALRLRAYVWPDQADRKSRLNNALEIAEAHPPVVDHEDALGWLDRNLTERNRNVCTVIYSTIAWQYLPPDARARGEEIIRHHAQDGQGSLAWLRFEPDGKTPGAGVRLQLWPEEVDLNLGRADFHGRWIDWA